MFVMHKTPSTVDKRLDTMFEIASVIAKRSSCNRAKVGCVITNIEMTQILAMGYNGNYRGGPNECDHPNAAGQCGCIHAEENALIKAPYTPGQLLLFSTTAPCLSCAKLILNAGIKYVFADTLYRDPSGVELLFRNHVNVTIRRMG